MTSFRCRKDHIRFAYGFFRIVDFTAPAIDLRPAGDAGFDAVAREIAVYDLIEQHIMGMGRHGMGAGADQRERSAECIEKLGQFIDGGLADETADACDARIVLCRDLLCGRITFVRIHGAELPDIDDLIIEAMALLLEDYRAFAVQLDGNGGRQHDGRQEDYSEQAENNVENPLGDGIPVVDWLVENIQHRHRADIGIGAGVEAQMIVEC